MNARSLLSSRLDAAALAATGFVTLGRSAESVRLTPPPAVDEVPALGLGKRNGGRRRRLLLGRAGRVPARQGRRQRRVRLCRRRQGHGEIRDGQHRRDRPRRIGRDHLRSREITLRQASSRSTSRSPTIRPSSTARARMPARSTVGDLPPDRRSGADRQGLYR